MRRIVNGRLRKLEAANAAARKHRDLLDAEVSSEQLGALMEVFLECIGVELRADESIRQAYARALGITCDELDELVSSGINPMNYYLDTHPNLDETRNAAK